MSDVKSGFSELNGYGKFVLLERRDAYAIITLNRPEKRNAMNVAAQRELCAALDATREDCRIIILTGAGSISFCAGIDLTEEAAARTRPARVFARDGNSWFNVQEAVARHPAIFIAAVNGFALGGGLTLVHNCELAIASETAQFGMPEMSRGMFPGLAGPATIHRLLPKRAAHMILLAQRVDARTAERWGIVNEVVAPTSLMSRAEELARHIARYDPILLDYTKKAIREIAALDWSRGIDYGISTGRIIDSLRSERPA